MKICGVTIKFDTIFDGSRKFCIFFIKLNVVKKL